MKFDNLYAVRLSTVVAIVAASVTIGTSAASAAPSQSFPGCGTLIEGQSGDCIKALQVYLNIDNPSYGLTEDRRFGRLTRIAVLDFQGRNRLPADGNVGPITADALIARAQVVQNATYNSYVDSPVPQPQRQSPASGGATALGRPVSECVKDLVKDKTFGDIVQKYAKDKLGMRDIVKKLAKISPPVDVAEAVWCVSFADPE